MYVFSYQTIQYAKKLTKSCTSYNVAAEVQQWLSRYAFKEPEQVLSDTLFADISTWKLSKN